MRNHAKDFRIRLWHQAESNNCRRRNVPWEEKQPPTILILHNDYELASDWAKSPGNETLIWVLLNVHGAFIAQCVHRRRSGLPKLAKRCRELCEALLV